CGARSCAPRLLVLEERVPHPAGERAETAELPGPPGPFDVPGRADEAGQGGALAPAQGVVGVAALEGVPPRPLGVLEGLLDAVAGLARGCVGAGGGHRQRQRLAAGERADLDEL